MMTATRLAALAFTAALSLALAWGVAAWLNHAWVVTLGGGWR